MLHNLSREALSDKPDKALFHVITSIHLSLSRQDFIEIQTMKDVRVLFSTKETRDEQYPFETNS